MEIKTFRSSANDFNLTVFVSDEYFKIENEFTGDLLVDHKGLFLRYERDAYSFSAPKRVKRLSIADQRSKMWKLVGKDLAPDGKGWEPLYKLLSSKGELNDTN